MPAPETMEPWRKALTGLINRHGQPAVVKALNVDTSTVSKWKSGERWPEPGMLLRICEAFDTTPDEIFGIRPTQQRPTRPEVVELALRLREAQEVVEPYLTDDDRESLEAALVRTRRALASRQKGRTRQAGRGSKP